MKIVDHVNRLPPRAQRMLALLVVPAAMASVWAGVVWPIWYAYQAQVQWRATAAHLLTRQRGVAGIEAAVRAQLDALPSLRSWQKLYRIAGESSAVIALQTEVNAVLSSARARPQSFTPIATTPAAPLRRVGLRIAVPMTIDQLKEVLMRVGELTHFVRIERLLVNAPAAQVPKENPTLFVTMDVVGYAIDAAAIETATMTKARNE